MKRVYLRRIIYKAASLNKSDNITKKRGLGSKKKP